MIHVNNDLHPNSLNPCIIKEKEPTLPAKGIALIRDSSTYLLESAYAIGRAFLQTIASVARALSWNANKVPANKQIEHCEVKPQTNWLKQIAKGAALVAAVCTITLCYRALRHAPSIMQQAKEASAGAGLIPIRTPISVGAPTQKSISLLATPQASACVPKIGFPDSPESAAEIFRCFDENFSLDTALETPKSLFRKAIRLFHPDKKGGDEAVMKAVNAAKDLLDSHYAEKALHSCIDKVKYSYNIRFAKEVFTCLDRNFSLRDLTFESLDSLFQKTKKRFFPNILFTFIGGEPNTLDSIIDAKNILKHYLREVELGLDPS